ncbi:MAG: hypothetical protein GY939_10440, partial [Actinomycetia bacterium]|nr:hypothetical protein [Actinomycetes bacterium]
MTPGNGASAPRTRFRHSIIGMIRMRLIVLAVVPVLVAAVLITAGALVTAQRAEDRISAAESDLAFDTIAAGHVSQAQAITSGVDRFVIERFDDAIEWGHDDAVVDAIAADYEQTETMAQWSVALIESRLDATDQLDASGLSASYLEAKVSGSSTHLGALFTDGNGYTIGAVGTGDAFVHREQDWWQAAWRSGAYIGQGAAVDGTDPSYILAIRIDHPANRRPLGVFQTTINGSFIQAMADAGADPSRGVEITVVDPGGLPVAQSVQPSTPTRGTVDGEEAVSLTIASSQRSGPMVGDDFVAGFATTSSRYTIERLGVDVTGIELAAVVVQPSSVALAPLDALNQVGPDLRSQAIVWALALAALATAAAATAYLAGRSLSRRIAQPISYLCHEAHRMADSELPKLVTALRSTDGSGELPVVDLIEIEGHGEVAELAVAFNRLRSATVELAASQAIDHSKELAGLLVNLGRRNQQLIGRQLRFIDELELTESDPDVLRNLFTLDQMATKMRRNAENLLVLAGERVSRGAGRPQRIEDVLRAATSEVEDFTRVQITTVERTLIRPVVVSDLTHLLAELIENGTRFSPHDTTVEVMGRRDADGSYTISVLDLGPGMSRSKLAEANNKIVHPTYTSDTPTSHLGLFVVGRLAARHLIDARLIESAIKGTIAKVTLPAGCLTPTPRPSGEVQGSRLTSQADAAAQEGASWPPPIRRPTTGQFPAIVVDAFSFDRSEQDLAPHSSLSTEGSTDIARETQVDSVGDSVEEEAASTGTAVEQDGEAAAGEVGVEPEAATEPVSESEAESASGADVKTELETIAESEPEANAEPEVEAEPELEAESESSDTATEPEVEAEPELETESESSDTATEPEVEAEPELEAESDPKANVEPGAEPELKAEPE